MHGYFRYTFNSMLRKNLQINHDKMCLDLHQSFRCVQKACGACIKLRNDSLNVLFNLKIRKNILSMEFEFSTWSRRLGDDMKDFRLATGIS